MVRDLQEVRIGRVGVQPLQRLGDVLVQPLPAQRVRLPIAHLPDQGVHELDGLSVAPEQPLLLRLFQHVQQVLVRHTADGGQGLEREAIAQEGREGEDPLGRLAEGSGVRDDRAGHVIGKPEVGRVERGDQISALVLERALVDQVMDHLLHEQRVPLCRLADGRGELVRRTLEPEAPDQLADLLLVQPFQCQGPTDVLPPDAADQAREPVLLPHRSMAANDDDGNRVARHHVGHGEHHVIEQVQRQSIGPVEIIHDQHRRGA